MSVEPKDPSGKPDPDPVDPDPEPVNPDPKPPGDSVSLESHQKLLAEKKKWQAKARDLEEQEQKREKDKLEETSQYKVLYEAEKEAKAKLEQELTEVQENRLHAKKFNAVLKGLPVQPEEQYWPLINLHLDKVVVDDSGTVDQNTAKSLVDVLQKQYPRIFHTSKGNGSVSDAPIDLGDGELTLEAWKKLPASEKRAKKHLIKRE